jgi:hypothetical protein
MQFTVPPDAPTHGRHEIAAGDIGDKLRWADGYEAFGNSQSLISRLWDLEWSEIDWDYLLADLPRFEFLRTLGPSEFFHYRAWHDVEGFRVVEYDQQEETGSMSGEWTYMHIEMDHSQTKEICHDFEKLCHRLENYGPLKAFL